MHSQHRQKLSGLNALITKISQSKKVEDHIEVTCESLKLMHHSKPQDQKFLSAAHLSLFLEYLSPLPRFEQPRQIYNEHYGTVKELVEKILGSDEPEIVTKFLRSQFQGLRTKKFSWNTLFANVDELADSISSRSFRSKMKKLLDKFTKGKALEFIHKMYPESRGDEFFLNHKVLQDLKHLCNQVSELRSQRRSNEHLLNFRRSIISCVVSTYGKKQLRKSG